MLFVFIKLNNLFGAGDKPARSLLLPDCCVCERLSPVEQRPALTRDSRQFLLRSDLFTQEKKKDFYPVPLFYKQKFGTPAPEIVTALCVLRSFSSGILDRK